MFIVATKKENLPHLMKRERKRGTGESQINVPTYKSNKNLYINNIQLNNFK